MVTSLFQGELHTLWSEIKVLVSLILELNDCLNK